MSVNADKLVQIIPRIIEGGTPGLTFAGLILSQSELLPAGRVVQFASAQAVANYFGSLSEEASMASMYFSGYVNTTSLPDKIFFARYNGEAVGAWLRGAKYTGNIAVLQAVTNGAMVISIDNTPHTLSSVDLSAATSFSQVAEAIQTALTTAGATGEGDILQPDRGVPDRQPDDRGKFRRGLSDAAGSRDRPRRAASAHRTVRCRPVRRHGWPDAPRLHDQRAHVCPRLGDVLHGMGARA